MPTSCSSIGVPPPASLHRANSVLVYNTPYVQEEDLKYDLGVYGQDQWT